MLYIKTKTRNKHIAHKLKNTRDHNI